MEVNTVGENGEVISSSVFELEWTIEKFETLQLGVGGKIEGDVFELAGFSWRLIFYPDGCDYKHSGISGIFLRLLTEGSTAEARASYQMWLVKQKPRRMSLSALAGIDLNGFGGSRPSTAEGGSRPTTADGRRPGTAPVEMTEEERHAEDCKYRLPRVPLGVTTAQRGGPRTFDNRKMSTSLASWGFPSFYRRSYMGKRDYLDVEGQLVIRCVIAVHKCSVPMGTDAAAKKTPKENDIGKCPFDSSRFDSVEWPVLYTRGYTCRPASRASVNNVQRQSSAQVNRCTVQMA